MLFKPKTDRRSDHRRSTHPRCPRLVTKLTALVTSLALSLTVLPTTALADKDTAGQGGGGSSSSTTGNYIYGYDEVANVSWKIDMYVSTNANGKIDYANDIIGSDELPWVGGVMYNNFFQGSRVQPEQVWLCTDSTNEIRNNGISTTGYITLTDKDGYPTGTQWALPNVTKVDKGDWSYYLTDGSPIAHVVTNSKDNPIGLPIQVEDIKCSVLQTS